MKKALLILLTNLAVQSTIHAQAEIGVELYKYFKTEPAIQPICHLQTADDWYAELRYNYEEAGTISAYGGKKILVSASKKFSIIPMVGISAGRFTGLSLAFNADAEWEKFFASSQTQYSRAIKKNEQRFFYSWSELGYSVCDNFYAGLSIQCTLQRNLNETKPGLLAGFCFKNISLPFYVFRPFQRDRTFILGLVYKYSYGKKS
jgi:hypothetical protein